MLRKISLLLAILVIGAKGWGFDWKGLTDRLKGDISSLQSQVSSWQNHANYLSGQLNFWRSHASNLGSTVSTLSNDLLDATDEITDLEGVRQLLEGDIDALTLGGSLGDVLDEITEKIEKIPHVEDVINGVKDTVTGLVDDLENVPGDIIKVFEILTKGNPLEFNDLPDEVEDFAATLEMCFGRFKSFLDPETAIKEILNIDDLEFETFNFPEPGPELFRILAKISYPLKPMMEFACNEGVPLLLSIVENLPNMIPSRRRRTVGLDDLPESAIEALNCADDSNYYDFCPQEEISLFYDDDDDNDNYKRMVNSFPLLMDKDGSADTEQIVILRVTKIIFQTVLVEAARIPCDILSALFSAVPTTDLEVIPVSACSVYMFFLEMGVNIMDYALESADIHDGAYESARQNAIYKNTNFIIRNQNKLRENITSYMDDVKEEINEHITSTFSAMYIAPKDPPTAHSENGGIMMHQRPIGLDNIGIEKGVTIIKINSRDLYVVIGVVVGFLIVFIAMAVLLTLKYCNEYNGRKGKYKVVEYDYSESETEAGKE